MVLDLDQRTTKNEKTEVSIKIYCCIIFNINDSMW